MLSISHNIQRSIVQVHQPDCDQKPEDHFVKVNLETGNLNQEFCLAAKNEQNLETDSADANELNEALNGMDSFSEFGSLMPQDGINYFESAIKFNQNGNCTLEVTKYETCAVVRENIGKQDTKMAECNLK